MEHLSHISSGTLVEDFDLKEFNTFGVSSVCSEFGVFTSAGELRNMLEETNGSSYILGGGSNVLLPAKWNCTVLHNRIMGKQVQDHHLTNVQVRVGAGENWNAFTRWCIRKGFGGIENLALIPGLVGAAPIQNIGAYGVELSDVLVGLYYLEIESGTVRWLPAEEAELSYRDSIFKHEWKGKICVLSIDLRLTREQHKLESSYGAIQEYLDRHDVEDPGIGDIRDAVVAIRKSKLPDPNELGNSGSFFKNPILDNDFIEHLKSSYPEMPTYPVNEDESKVPAGWLIEECGWKGRRIGSVGCYEDQALVIVNYGNATSDDILGLAKKVRTSVFETFGIELEPEVNLIDQSLS